MLDGKTNGEYLEIGSADPYKGSNTYLLEKLGWTGLSLEIIEEEVVRFREHRKILLFYVMLHNMITLI